ncbi:BTAD domain-containing putative transcriptional regulator [Allorhizocola rhizosphaerae]|uniref:BTAD domain-containing putative transcriptional regulator n=1 Tax=Allorhizocola rhizosphaerae TaxID=1872709 RepID=UPI000E3DC489|nr:BTAD domain-containing putative transcriptional regulator [Allorhizocola rhizosphaerae]
MLGPVELAGPNGVVPFGGPRLRTLFGLLALRAPRVVSRTALIDGVWDDDPPAAAAKTLRAHIAHLRGGFAAAGLGELIATRPPGYAITLPPPCIDAHRFEAGVQRGRSALAKGALPEAITHLRAALTLWRGDVLADCVLGEWARAEATRLRSLWHVAMEDLLAAELTAGQHAVAAAELESLVARYPLRERLWELLMRALLQSGRRSEALHAYQRARHHLVADLGMEPGTELQRLQAAVLNGQAAEPAHAAKAQSSPPHIVIPSPLTRLIGRRAELADLYHLLERHRLITLTGPGGCGKTRLAIAAASEVAEGYADGARFIDLAPVTDSRLVASTVASMLGVAEDPTVSPLQALSKTLRPMRYLTLLDNCEHLVDACAELVSTLMRTCPGLHVLATSRQPLGVPGEVVFPVPLLAVPPRDPEGGLAAVTSFDSVQLLLERSGIDTVRNLTDADAPALAAICASLDGVPLAIELVAARTSVLTMAEIADRLNEPALLRVRRYADHPHHRALDSSIGWSYDMLDPAAQSRFRQLAVFAGGFTLAAAQAVWESSQRIPAVDVLTDLVARSLVVVQHNAGGGNRYRLLETVRAWAGDRLAEQPEEAQRVRSRHAAHFLAEAEEANRWLRGPAIDRWLPHLATEHDNFRAALAYYAELPDSLPQLRLAVALSAYCRLRGHYTEGRRWLETALSKPEPEHETARELVGDALARAAQFAFLLSDYAQAQQYAERALARQHPPAAAQTLRLLGSIALERGDYERSLAHLRAALAAVTDPASQADVLQRSGFTEWLSGNVDRAHRLLQEAFRRYQIIGDTENAASTRIHLAATALYQGRLEQARELADEALATFTKLDVGEGSAWALNLLGLVELRQGRPGDAIVTLRASLELHEKLGDRWRQASVLEALAAAHAETGALDVAAELLERATDLRKAIGAPVPAIERPAYERLVLTISSTRQ